MSSSAFAGMKISTSDGKMGAKTRPISGKRVKPKVKAPTKKKITFPYEVRPPTLTPNDAEGMCAEEEFKEHTRPLRRCRAVGVTVKRTMKYRITLDPPTTRVRPTQTICDSVSPVTIGPRAERETSRIGLAGMGIDVEAGPPATGEEEDASEGEANARPLHREREKPEALKQRPPTRDEEEEEDEMSAEEEFKEENQIAIFRKFWERVFGGYFGSFDDETRIGPMRYTSQPNVVGARREQTLQIFSIRVTDPTDGLEWPLHVHGYVAARDTIDHKRNYLFRRTRDNCQTLTQNDPLLHLTGPSRAVVLVDPIMFEVELKVKGKGESEDEMLAFGTFVVQERSHGKDGFLKWEYHRRCTLQYKFALLPCSVEATISVKVVEGSWPENHGGEVVGLTSSVDEKVVLLHSSDGEMPINSDGVIELSRRVVSVESCRKLLVAVDATRSGFLGRGAVVFKPKKSGTSHAMCDLNSCKMEVTVAWSRFNVFAR